MLFINITSSIRMNFNFKSSSTAIVGSTSELSLMIVIVVVVVVGLIVSADVDHQTGRVVSHHVEELSLKLELVDLVLAVSPRQHGDNSVHFPHPGHHLSLPS